MNSSFHKKLATLTLVAGICSSCGNTCNKVDADTVTEMHCSADNQIDEQAASTISTKEQETEGTIKMDQEIEDPMQRTIIQPDQEVIVNVVQTPSGLKYIILQEADTNAPKPTAGKKISAHYTGWLYDENAEDNKGLKFDSSVDRGRALDFIVGVGQVIQGWDEALLDMQEGEKRRLIIPANLAYGNRSVGGVIPANATLVFDVELVKAS